MTTHPEDYAFPVAPGDVPYWQPGMTLRDWFAGQAPEMPEQWWLDTKAQYGGKVGSYAEAIAAWRYFYADAMLAARAKRGAE